MTIWIDGKYHDENTAAVSVFDHGLLYGDGVFEGLRIYNGKIFKLELHTDRLFDSAKAILLDIGMTKNQMNDVILRTTKKSGIQDGYVRLVVTRGKGSLGLDPASCEKATIVVIAGGIQLYPPQMYKNGISVITTAVRRPAPDVLDPRVKSLNYLNNIMGKLQAKAAGCLEAIMLNDRGYICECTADNIFLVKDGEVKTPPACEGALCGITRDTVLELGREAHISCCETPLTLYDIYTADEVFMTGSGAEIMPVNKADNRIIGDGTCGAITRRLREAFTLTVGR